MPLAYDPSRVALYTPERRETIFVPGQSYAPLQLAVEAARLVYYRAETSAAELERLTAALALVGFEPPALFVAASTGTFAFGARRRSDATTIVAFRGTRPDAVADLLTDGNAFLTAWPESAGRVHAGFAAAARAVLPPLERWLAGEPRDSHKLILTGHSLGAALATLAATVLRPDLVVTLGSPRVGDAAFVATLAGEFLRLVDCCDAVTDLPPPIFYTHVGPSTYLTRKGKQVVGPADRVVRRDRFRARFRYLLRYAWRKGSVLIRDFADHAPINYVRCFFP